MRFHYYSGDPGNFSIMSQEMIGKTPTRKKYFSKITRHGELKYKDACLERCAASAPAAAYDDVNIIRYKNSKDPAGLCKRRFGSPRIWIPHPKTLADLDDPERGFGSPADLDPSIYFVCDRLEIDDVEFWEPNPRTPTSADLAPPRIWIPIPEES